MSKLNKLSAELCEACMDKTLTTRAHVFFEFNAHIAEIRVRIHMNGWKSGSNPDWEGGVYLDWGNAEDGLEAMIDTVKSVTSGILNAA